MNLTNSKNLAINGVPLKTLFINGHQVWTAEDPTNYLTFESQQAVSTIKLVANGSPNPISLEYKTDNGRWQTYTIGQQLSLLEGRHVQFRGNNTKFSKDASNFYSFQMTGKIAASGSVMSLVDQSDEYRTVGSYEFYRLFYQCSALTTPPELPATYLNNYCYKEMFGICSALTTPPELPAPVLALECYYGMFSQCTALTEAPVLPAMNIAENCYMYMFKGCTALTEAPELPATTIDVSCYNAMFEGCSALTEAPALPAMETLHHCYANMFLNCTALATPPELPSMTMTDACYANMFAGCTSLVQAPELPATTLYKYCYYEMFRGCSSLNYIKVSFTSWSGSFVTSNWVSGVASTGTFVCPPTLPQESGVSRIPSGWAVDDQVNYLTFTALQDSSSLTLSKIGNPNSISLEYRTSHDAAWQTYTVGTTLSMMKDWIVQFRGNNSTFSLNGSSYYRFTMAGKYAASGSIMTLLDKTDTLRTLPSNAFNRLFHNCSQMTTPPEIPATTMGEACFDTSFNGCSGMTVAPELPATNLAKQCYSGMFMGCSSITQAPALPATELKEFCYNSMFESCTNMTTPPELPATTVLSRVYSYMFKNCRNLETAPELPASTLADTCYYEMFNGCAKIDYIKVGFTAWSPTNATQNWLNGVSSSGTFVCKPTLPEERSTSRIPTGWTIVDSTNYLTFTALQNNSTIKLVANNTPDPISLEYRTNHEDTWHSYTIGDTLSMMSGWTIEFRGDNATFSKDQNSLYQFQMTGKYAASGSLMTLLDKTDTLREVPANAFAKLFMFNTAITTAPEMPATTLGNGAYYGMFFGASALTGHLELPAPHLSDSCYGQFITGTKLSSIKVAFSSWTEANGTWNWVTNLPTTGTFICPQALPQEFGGNRIPTGWTVEQNVA